MKTDSILTRFHLVKCLNLNIGISALPVAEGKNIPTRRVKHVAISADT